MSSSFSRRRFGLLAGAAALAPALAPARSRGGRPWASRSAVDPRQRRFLFLHCRGGWDPTVAFVPLFDGADMEEGAQEATVGGLRFVDHPDRPSVRAFYERWADRCCLVNGVEVRSVAHDRCERILLTGTGSAGRDDWPSLLAAHASDSPVLPHLLLAGPAFNARYADRVVRIGDNGQLPELLSGLALQQVDGPPFWVPEPGVEALEAAFLKERLARLEQGGPGGDAGDFASRYARLQDQLGRLSQEAGGIDLNPSDLGCERDLVADAATAFDCFEAGLSRCAMLRYAGWCGEGWDTHTDTDLQSINFEDLYRYLDGILSDLASRTAPSGAPLEDEVTICVFSEMGRAPRRNSWGGKDHWTFTSTMLLGSGIAGGQTIGDLDARGMGRPVDLDSGDLHAGGQSLVPNHLGATLLRLGGMDPTPWVGEVPALAAALSEG
jgi:hypothetical protein